MKKLFLTLALASAGYYSYAQTWSGTTPGNIYYNSGNVGIGTATPTGLLHLASANSIDLFMISSATGGYSRLFFGAGTNGARWNVGQRDDTGGIFSIESDASGTGAWGSRLAVTLDGKVGIGTTSPGYKLEVAGSFGTRGMMGNGSTGQYYEVGPYEIASHNNAGWAGTMIGIRSGGMNSTSIPITQNVLANSTAYQQAWAMTFGTDKSQTNGAAFSVWTGDATNAGTPMSELFRIRYDGNVGIGTANPGIYKLAVNGGIHSKSVNVDLTGWSDFVFKQSYILPTLTEVKAYIDRNHHLPDMPSEQEVVKDGINLGEMNKLLTKKVEELTLYAIQQQEENEKLKAENKTLKEGQQKVDQAQQEQIDELKRQLTKILTKS